jgi:hypothetical protein
MSLEKKIEALHRIYALYDAYTERLSLSCRKFCDHCCTCNLTATGLEVQALYRGIPPELRTKIRAAAGRQVKKRRYIPSFTINQAAGRLAEGGDPPEDEEILEEPPCPILSERHCPVYTSRPFGCRCLISESDCALKGCACIDSYSMAVNYLFSQFIEHLDQGGVTGNFSDLLIAMKPSASSSRPEGSVRESGFCLLPNLPIPLLLIPPEHQGRIRPLIDSLHAIVSRALNS